jgi:hypothetical protein
MSELLGMINLDLTITAGNLIEIATIAIGGIGVVIMLRKDVSALKANSKQLKIDLDMMRSEMKKLGDIMVRLADIRGELRVLDTRITLSEQDVRELRHGEGFIVKSGRRRPPATT